VDRGYTEPEIDWAIQNARVVGQAADLARNPNIRDPGMAKNIQWIVNQAPPGSKIVLWAHDYHVSRYDGAMGSYLASQYGKDYVVLGFGFHEGSYNAVGPQGLKPYTAAPSFPGSAEYVFHQTGMPQFILDLRQASPDSAGSAWVIDDVQFQTIGAVPVDGFAVTRLVHDYDAIIYAAIASSFSRPNLQPWHSASGRSPPFCDRHRMAEDPTHYFRLTFIYTLPVSPAVR
jgi:erythromycin esterase-like protein